MSNKTAPNEYQTAIENLKDLLKARKITYRDLAEGLGLSESGVKKILSSKDASFQRLVQICKYVGISLNELLEDQRSVPVDFNEKQQSEFLKEPLLFQVFWMLVYERRSVEGIKKSLRLSKADAFRLFRKLDVLGLIELLPDERLNVPAIRAIHWAGDGEFYKKIYRDWAKNLISDVAKPRSPEDELFLIRYLQMTKKTYADYMLAQKDLEQEFVRRSIQEMRLQAPGLEHVRLLTAADRRSFVTGRKVSEEIT